MYISSQYHNWSHTISVSKRLLELGTEADDEWTGHSTLIGSMILSVAALESFLNSLGSNLFQESTFKKFERRSIIKKINILARVLSVRLSKKTRPYQTIRHAVSWRNLLLHSKPRRLENVYLPTEKDFNRQMLKNKKYEYEGHVSEKTAERFIDDIFEIIKALSDRSGFNNPPAEAYTDDIGS